MLAAVGLMRATSIGNLARGLGFGFVSSATQRPRVNYLRK